MNHCLWAVENYQQGLSCWRVGISIQVLLPAPKNLQSIVLEGNRRESQEVSQTNSTSHAGEDEGRCLKKKNRTNQHIERPSTNYRHEVGMAVKLTSRRPVIPPIITLFGFRSKGAICLSPEAICFVVVGHVVGHATARLGEDPGRLKEGRRVRCAGRGSWGNATRAGPQKPS